MVSHNSLCLCSKNGCVAFVFLRHYADTRSPFLPDNRRWVTLEVEGCDPGGAWCRVAGCRRYNGCMAVAYSAFYTASVSIADADYRRLLQLPSGGLDG